MRLATIQSPNGPRGVVVQGDHYIDLKAINPLAPDSLRHLLELGPTVLKAVEEAARQPGVKKHRLADARLLPPIPDPRKIVCLGLNYRDHAIESGAPIPKDPVLFSKYATALIGSGEAIVLPSVSQEVDYEAELVIVVGKRGRNVRSAEAMSHVAGYTIGHDVSAR